MANDLNKTLLIAIDGPSSSGKGTIAKKIASYFKIPCLNTGGLYRAIALLSLNKNLNLENNEKEIIQLCPEITKINLESIELHNEKVAKAASIIAANENIRKAIFDLQRNFALKAIKDNGGAVLEGRDIGTVILPEANYKFFITAKLEVRAKRRFYQLKEFNNEINYKNILEQIKQRDNQDINRPVSPLKKAKDAILIDNSDLDIKQTLDKIISYIKKNKR